MKTSLTEAEARARADRVAICPRPRADRPPTDRRVSLALQDNLSPIGKQFMHVLRGAILAACKRRVLTREHLAGRLMVPAKKVDKWMSPSHDAAPRFDQVLQILAPDGPLPETERAWVLAWMDREVGRVTVDLVAADADESPLSLQVLQVFAAGGRVADLVEQLTAEASAGGKSITPAEAAALLPLARDQAKEAAELVATLERVAVQTPAVTRRKP